MEESTLFLAWHYWLVAAILLMIIEALVPGFVLACLSIGSLGGMVAAFFTDSWEIQLLVASLLSILAFIFVRPFALKRLFRKNELKTNVDSLVGKRARVSQAFDHELLKGRVAIDGDDWMAYSRVPGDFSLGTVVEIESVESNTLIIKPIHTS
jgi:membrane protein implicated in regulation of membrane protease activity